MSAPMPPPYRLMDPNLRPFPTRGVTDGWRDPWDADPYDAVVAALRQRNALRRHVTEAGVQLELMAQVRADGRWTAEVIVGDAPANMWPSTNGPSAARALDALELELRELIRSTDGVADPQR